MELEKHLVDVDFIATAYSIPRPHVGLAEVDAAKILGRTTPSMEEFQPDDELKTILEKERAFEAQMSRVT